MIVPYAEISKQANTFLLEKYTEFVQKYIN